MTYTPIVYTANYWAPQLAAAAPDLPVARLVAWIAEETNGNPAGLGSIWEVGIFQINFADAKTGTLYGATVAGLHGNFTSGPHAQDRNRSLTADEEALQVSSGIAYVRECLTFAQGVVVGYGWSDADTWCMTKMRHALPAVCTDLWRQAMTAGHVSSWSDFAGYATSLQQSELPASIQPYHYKLASKIFPNAGRVGAADGATPDGTGTAGGQPLGIAAIDLISALAIGALIAIAYFFTR